MQDVVATVSEQWESPLADELLLQWEHDAIRPQYWRSSANFVFFCEIRGRDHVLRFNHEDERTAEIIQSEIDFVNALAGSGLNVAKPIRSKSGNYVESVSTSHGIFHAVIFEALPGKQLDLEELSAPQIRQWGQALGELHHAAARLRTSGRPGWQEQLAAAEKSLSEGDYQARQAITRLISDLQTLALSEDNYGLIHFDFEPDNLIWNEGGPGVIDFDDCAWNWFAADIACAVEDLVSAQGTNAGLRSEPFLLFMQGYRSVRPIEQAELEHIPLFWRFQHMLDYARLARALTPVKLTGELAWMAALRDKLATRMQQYREEFVV